MRYRTDFKTGDAVYYKTRTGKQEKIAAVVIAVNNEAETNSEFAEMYAVKVTTSRCSTYSKGNVLTTSGNYLLRRGSTKKDSNDKGRPENKGNQATQSDSQKESKV